MLEINSISPLAAFASPFHRGLMPFSVKTRYLVGLTPSRSTSSRSCSLSARITLLEVAQIRHGRQGSLDELPIKLAWRRIAAFNRAITTKTDSGAPGHILLSYAGCNPTELPAKNLAHHLCLDSHSQVARKYFCGVIRGVKTRKKW